MAIELPLAEWQECMDAMKTLLKTNKETLKMEEISANVNKINEKIFLKRKSNDITLDLSNLTDKQFDEILEEIKQESADNNVCFVFVHVVLQIQECFVVLFVFGLYYRCVFDYVFLLEIS